MGLKVLLCECLNSLYLDLGVKVGKTELFVSITIFIHRTVNDDDVTCFIYHAPFFLEEVRYRKSKL